MENWGDNDSRVPGDSTEQVEVLNELVLSACLVGGTEDASEQTTGEDAREDAVGMDLRLAQAASSRGTTALGLSLVDGGRATVGSNAEGESEDGTVDSGEVHCDWFWK